MVPTTACEDPAAFNLPYTSAQIKAMCAKMCGVCQQATSAPTTAPTITGIANSTVAQATPCDDTNALCGMVPTTACEDPAAFNLPYTSAQIKAMCAKTCGVCQQATPAPTTAPLKPASLKLQKQMVDTARYPLAVCNDGSPAAFYMRPPPPSAAAVSARYGRNQTSTSAATNWVVHFAGGGKCNTEAHQ